MDVWLCGFDGGSRKRTAMLTRAYAGLAQRPLRLRLRLRLQ
ncbi:hypothetical protein BSIN_5187 [Burkholderia singularis]|uniref:Uncharacterized protein n=1 Tax=Burkholderia singularis TaxID=1503053 RepID=A0A238HD00_9BURK|nr:hypothetical protein BSIN_5187 [Burkholderia singularis]